MPTRQRARKRALIQDDDSSGRTDALRSLLSQPRLHVKNLNGIVRSLEREPDLLSAHKDELAAVSAGYFESVRQRKQVLLRNGTFSEWVFADPNLLLQRTLRECPNLAELYAQKWHFPQATARKMRNIWHIFDSYARSHMDNRIKFKATASELLGMYVLLRHWVLTVVCIQPVDLASQTKPAQKKSWQSCKTMRLAKSSALQDAIDVSLRLHIIKLQ